MRRILFGERRSAIAALGLALTACAGLGEDDVFDEIRGLEIERGGRERLTALSLDPAPDVRRAACDALGRLDGPVDALVARIGDSAPPVRYAAAAALMRSPDPAAADALRPLCEDTTVVAADSGYCSQENLEKLEAKRIEGFIPDNGYRQRDPRYAGQDQHTAKPDPLWDKRPKDEKASLFRPADFQVAEDCSHCICPAGKRLYRNGANCNIGGHKAIKFTGTLRDCKACPLRAQCLRHPDKTPVRQVAIFQGKHEKAKESALDRMKRKIDSEQGRDMIARRFATVEPVFGNIRYNKRMNRFTLRGQAKVDGQWKLYCLVHNIEKLAHHGYAR